jgi:hypothetical protein
MGCVRYAERYFFNPNGQRVEDVMNYIPTADQINSAHQAIKDTLKGVQFQEIRDTQGTILANIRPPTFEKKPLPGCTSFTSAEFTSCA